jgi:hypothetical protein
MEPLLNKTTKQQQWEAIQPLNTEIRSFMQDNWKDEWYAVSTEWIPMYNDYRHVIEVPVDYTDKCRKLLENRFPGVDFRFPSPEPVKKGLKLSDFPYNPTCASMHEKWKKFDHGRNKMMREFIEMHLNRTEYEGEDFVSLEVCWNGHDYEHVAWISKRLVPKCKKLMKKQFPNDQIRYLVPGKLDHLVARLDELPWYRKVWNYMFGS